MISERAFRLTCAGARPRPGSASYPGPSAICHRLRPGWPFACGIDSPSGRRCPVAAGHTAPACPAHRQRIAGPG